MRILIVLFAFLLVTPAVPALARELTVYCEYKAPEDVPAEALTQERVVIYTIVREVMRRTDVSKPIFFASWKKGYSEATAEPNVGLFPTSRTAQREEMFHWIGPILTVKWAFIAKADAGIVINSLDDARAMKRIGVYRHDAKEQWLQANGFTNLVSSMDNQQNLKKILHGRIDLMVSTPSATRDWAVEMAFDFDRELRVVHVFKSMDLYLALSQKTDPATVSALKAAFNDMVEDGTYHSVYETHGPNLDIPVVK